MESDFDFITYSVLRTLLVLASSHQLYLFMLFTAFSQYPIR